MIRKSRAKQRSTYFFIGKLSDNLAKYQVQQIPLKNNFYFEVYLSGISIWGNTKEPFDKLFPKIKEMFKTIIAAFVFKTNKPLFYSLENWLETKEVIAEKNIIGWLFPPFSPIEPYPQRSRKNTAWKKAVWLFNNLHNKNGNYLLALKDYYSALTDTSDDAFLFAYRSIEDICRAVNGCDETEKSEWIKLHKRLRTSKSVINPLTKVAEKVRHGNKNHKIVIQARKNRNKLIDIAYYIIEKELKITFPKFF